jgi:DNA topoisomerase III
MDPREVTTHSAPQVHTFRGAFRGQQVNFKVTSVVGHVFSTDFPSAYQSWDKVDPGTLFDAPVERVAEKKGIVHMLQNEGKGCDYVVLWLDCDKEGENICFEVISCIMPQALKQKELRTPGPQQRVFRAKFSAITPSDIHKAMGCLAAPNENESLSVEARQELDLKVGVAFSRFQTRFFQGKYSDLDSRIVSYGPCQTPTLGFCVERHILIQNFKPEPYWQVAPQVKYPGFGTVKFEWARGRLFDQRIAAVFRQLILEAGVLRITAVHEREVKKGRPTPMNTVAMLKAASKQLGMGPAAAMHAAENLYLQGYLSYPRTESTAYPASFDIAEQLRHQTRSPVWGEYVADLLPNHWTRPKAGVDVGDHPPITPCRYASSSDLYGEQGRLYDLVVKHFLASVSPGAPVSWCVTYAHTKKQDTV